jgi:hypothetical protein
VRGVEKDEELEKDEEVEKDEEGEKDEEVSGEHELADEKEEVSRKIAVVKREVMRNAEDTVPITLKRRCTTRRRNTSNNSPYRAYKPNRTKRTSDDTRSQSPPQQSNVVLPTTVEQTPEPVLKEDSTCGSPSEMHKPANPLEPPPLLDEFSDIQAIDFEQAVARIIGQEKVDDINQGSTVEVCFPWMDKPLTNICNVVMLQMRMYDELGQGTTHCVHTAVQLAMRQDLLLWMLSAWLFQSRQMIALPIPASALDMTLVGKQLLDITASVSRERIDINGLNIRWQALQTISSDELAVIVDANLRGGAVSRTDDGSYKAVDFIDERAVLFVHNHPISRALLGWEPWQSRLVRLHVDELLDASRTVAAIKAHSGLMIACMVDSAMRSLRLDAALRPETCFISTMKETFSVHDSGEPLQATWNGVGVLVDTLAVAARSHSVIGQFSAFDWAKELDGLFLGNDWTLYSEHPDPLPSPVYHTMTSDHSEERTSKFSDEALLRASPEPAPSTSLTLLKSTQSHSARRNSKKRYMDLPPKVTPPRLRKGMHSKRLIEEYEETARKPKRARKG